MKVCKYLVFLLLLIQSFIGYSQEKYIVTLSPALFMPGGIVAVQPGFGVHLNDEWVLQSDVAFAVTKQPESQFQNKKFFRTSLEIKTLAGLSAYFEKYVSFQVAYSIRNFSDNDSGSFKNTKYGDNGFLYSSSLIKSPVLSFAIKTGREYEIGERFLIDVFTGIGTRTIFTKYEAQGVQPATITEPMFAFKGNPAWTCNCTQTRFHFVAGIRIGAKF